MKTALLRRARDLAGRYAEREPLRSAVIAYYRALLWDVRRTLSAREGVESIFYRSRVDYPQFRPGLSDVDVLVVVRPEAVEGPRGHDLGEAIRRLILRWPLLQSIVPVTIGEAADRSSIECLPYRMLLDYAALHGGPALPEATSGDERRMTLAAAMLGSWYMLVYFPRWLFDCAGAQNTNYRKIFFKALVFCGVPHEEADSASRAALSGLDLESDVRDAARRAGELERVYARIAERSAIALEGALSSLVPSNATRERPIAISPLPPDERARAIERELEREISGLEGVRVLLCGSADGPASYCMFIYRLEGFWTEAEAGRARRWWHAARDRLGHVTSMLEPVIGLPILTVRSSLPSILTLDISRKLYCLSHGLLEGLLAPDPGLDRASLELEAGQILTSNYRFQLHRAERFETVLLYRIPTLVLLLRGFAPTFGNELHGQLEREHGDIWGPVEALRSLLGRWGELSPLLADEANSHTGALLDALSESLRRRGSPS